MVDKIEYFAEVAGVRAPYVWELKMRRSGGALTQVRYDSEPLAGHAHSYEAALADATKAAEEFEYDRIQRETKRIVSVLSVEPKAEVSERTLAAIPVMERDPHTNTGVYTSRGRGNPYDLTPEELED